MPQPADVGIYLHFHFTDEEIEAQGDELTCAEAHSWSKCQSWSHTGHVATRCPSAAPPCSSWSGPPVPSQLPQSLPSSACCRHWGLSSGWAALGTVFGGAGVSKDTPQLTGQSSVCQGVGGVRDRTSSWPLQVWPLHPRSLPCNNSHSFLLGALGSSHAGLMAVPPVGWAHFCLRAFALADPQSGRASPR